MSMLDTPVLFLVWELGVIISTPGGLHVSYGVVT